MVNTTPSESAEVAATSSGLAAMGLHSIDWDQLDHAYGPAEDTPRLLETLYRSSRMQEQTDNGEKKDRDEADKDPGRGALYELYGSIAHQGSRYSASKAAVPFVYAILSSFRDAGAVRHRVEVVVLLGILAVGSPYFQFPTGVDTVAWRASVAEHQTPGWAETEEARRAAFMAEADGDDVELRRRRIQVIIMPDPDEIVKTSTVELGCYDAVRDGLASVLSCLQASDLNTPNVRSEAALLLALFPESPQADASEQALRQLLARETLTSVRGTALLALGLLRKKRKDTEESPATASIKKLLEETYATATAKREADSSDLDALFEQWCSAAALVTLLGAEEAGDAIVIDLVAPLTDETGAFEKYLPKDDKKEEGKRSAEKKESERSEDKKEPESFPFAAADGLDGLIGSLLADIKGSQHPEVARTVMGAFVKATGYAVTELGERLLDLVFDGQKPPRTTAMGSKSQPQKPFAELTPLQQEGIRTLLKVTDFGWVYSNYLSVLRDWGLPSKKDELEAYIEGRVQGEPEEVAKRVPDEHQKSQEEEEGQEE
ncbi:hypothetical protein SEUCBS139899_009781 [Sporothrix eucalyptigena]|uniref:Uncharacterized protein n=1 Tax=Sporothrix eucalyptigena TaxID=1812306 RepID=A0ABP0CYQ2_9PEZI